MPAKRPAKAPARRGVPVRIWAPAADVERWRAAAEADGRTLSDWVRRELTYVAARHLEIFTPKRKAPR
jgi:hypothetical protein